MKEYTPEQVDEIIKSRLAQFSRKGGHNRNSEVKWSEEEIELRNTVIISYLTENCISREQTARNIALRWDINIGTARKYVLEAVKNFCNNFTEDDDKAKRIFLETLHNLIADSVDKGQKDSALRALEMIAKAQGFYPNKQEVNLQASGKLEFNFGQEDNDNGN